MKRFPLLLLSALLLAPATARADDRLLPAFDTAAVRLSAGRPDKKDFTCTAPPAPPRDLYFESKYKVNDESRSFIDPEAEASYKTATIHIHAFEKDLAAMANRYLRSNPPRADVAACVQDWLAAWAKEGALLGTANKTGEHIRKWVLGTASNAWLQIRDAPALDPEKSKAALDWIRAVGEKVKDDFSLDPRSVSRRNNHLYWAAWGAASAAIAANDRGLFDWAMDKAREGLDQIGQNGTLPLERARGKKAFHYHLFAALPLFMLAEAAQRNGVDLFSHNDSALRRLGALCLKNLGTEGADFKKETGRDQDLDRTGTASDLGWIEIYARHYPFDPRAEEALKKFRPFHHSRMGGDMTLLYRSRRP